MPHMQRWTRSGENSARAGGSLEPEQWSLLLPQQQPQRPARETGGHRAQAKPLAG